MELVNFMAMIGTLGTIFGFLWIVGTLSGLLHDVEELKKRSNRKR